MTGEETGRAEPKPFRMNTETVPEGVDPNLAVRRTTLIEKWRAGEAEAEATMRELLDLYWETQHTTTGETNTYLMQASYQFPVEAGIPMDVADAIWQESSPRH